MNFLSKIKAIAGLDMAEREIENCPSTIKEINYEDFSALTDEEKAKYNYHVTETTHDELWLHGRRLNDSGQQQSDIKDIMSLSGASSYQITDAIDAPMAVSGAVRNLLKVTTTSQEINGVTFTVNADGSITANGTANANTYLGLATYITEKRKYKYCISGCPKKNAGSNSYKIECLFLENETWKTERYDFGDGVICDSENLYNSNTIAIRIFIAENFEADNMVFKPMLEEIPDGADESEYPHEYVPYSYDVTACGRNLIKQEYKNGESMTPGQNSNIRMCLNERVFLKSGKKFIMHVNFEDYFWISPFLASQKTGGEVIWNVDSWKQGSVIFTTSEDSWFECTFAYGDNTFGNVWANRGNLKPILEEIPSGTDESEFPHAYEPYHGNTITITGDTEFPVYGLSSYADLTNVFSTADSPISLDYATTKVGEYALRGAGLHTPVTMSQLVNQEGLMAMDAVQNNPSVAGTLAASIASLNSNLGNMISFQPFYETVTVAGGTEHTIDLADACFYILFAAKATKRIEMYLFAIISNVIEIIHKIVNYDTDIILNIRQDTPGTISFYVPNIYTVIKLYKF